ncbi:unnamed protein product [Musa acuminata subsp. malaccensis]|uniref:(wild Malaysian banana) hypothetical protein n=1 Tax=Musa acuminata subsp. malaccensis TaxID=214687 RepID=A0A804KR15_MUSAM|nr:PREDICTED: zinc finger CCCH domain-containing protein 35-like [Musa acuminata subsp. malaccensis]CAG1852093.1 unnamed protein product [Musa acuminata subsp. malaccensis]
MPWSAEATGEHEKTEMMSMMIGRGSCYHNATVHVPPWASFDDPTAGDVLQDEAALAALHLCVGREEEAGEEDLSLVDAYASDEFRMYEFKVRRCARGRAHDWTECPFAHPGEKARRRDPRKHRYSGTSCPDFRKTTGCKRGDACELAHGVFECWLHPDRYRTQPCKDGTTCRRRVCFFAHTPDQLRVVPPQHRKNSPSTATAADSYDGSPPRRHSSLHSYLPKNIAASPTSTLISPPNSPPTESPPISPDGAKLRRGSWHAGSSVNEIVASLRQLQLSRAESAPISWGSRVGSVGFASPRGASFAGFNAGFCGLPSTPTAPAMTCGDSRWLEEEEPAERVESGRALRAKMFERLSKGSTFEKAEAAPDVGWVTELLK